MKSKSISRSISLFLVLALCFTMFPCTVFAADTISTEPMRLPTLEDVLAGNVTPEEFEFFINTTPPSTAYDISAVTSVTDGTYYINNRYCGEFLTYTSSATTQSGTTSSLGNSILWEVSSVSGGYTIRSKSDTTKYLGVPSSTSSALVSIVTVSGGASVPSRCIWNISTANGGGVLIKSTYNSRYLYSLGDTLSTLSSTGTVGSSDYDSKVWRIATNSYYGPSGTYKELTSFSTYAVSINVGEPINPTIAVSPGNTLWTSANDFSYSTGNPYNVDYRTGTIIGAQGGSAYVTATHKVTGFTSTFYISVTESMVSGSCLENSTYNARYVAGNGSSVFSNGVVWSSSDSTVATVSSSGLVTGISSGYAFISAETLSGNTVLMCEVKVNNLLSQKLSVFNENEIQYLYCPYTYLDGWTSSLPEPFEFKLELMYCLRDYYTLPESQQPNGTQIANILYEELGFSISDDHALAIFNECYLGYNGLYNHEYLTSLRKQYFNYMKEIVAFCAFSMAANLAPINSQSNCGGYADLIDDLANQWGHNKSSSTVMLGSSGYENKWYNKIAEEFNFRYFFSNDYDNYLAKYGSDFVRSVNIKYLDNCLANNCTFYFSHNPATAPTSGSLYMEYMHLYSYYRNLWGNAFLKTTIITNPAGKPYTVWFFSPTN